MSYCTIADVTGKNTALLSDCTNAYINALIASAQVLVDGMLRNRYPVPLASPDALIADITSMLAASVAISEVVGNKGSDEDPIQSTNLYKQAMDQLKLIQEGKLVLDIPDPSTTTEDDNVGREARCTTYKTEPKFTKLCRHTGQYTDWNPYDPSTYNRHRR